MEHTTPPSPRPPAMKRRSFLKGLLGTAATAVVAPKAVPQLLNAMQAPAAAPALPAVQKAVSYIPISNELLADDMSLEAAMTARLVRRHNEWVARELYTSPQ